MTWTTPIIAFLREHGSPTLREAQESWLRTWLGFYDVQACLGVASREGGLLGVGVAVRARR